MKIDARGRITIPKALRERYGLHPGVEVELVPLPDGIAIQKKPVRPVDEVTGIIKLRFGKDVDDFIEQVRGR